MRNCTLSRTDAMPIFGGLIAVILFAATLPVTRLAVAEMSPFFVGIGRAAAATPLAMLYLLFTRSALPGRQHWLGLLLVIVGVVVGFPLLSAIAMHLMQAHNAASTVALLPIATTIWGVVLGGERHPKSFWFAAIAGVGIVAGLAISRSSGMPSPGDAVLLGALVLAGLGYASGAIISRSIGGAATISWAVCLALPISLPCLLFTRPTHNVSAQSWFAFSYVSAVSMFLGFLLWYAALARGGIGRIGQLQLLQPVLLLVIAAILAGESVSWHEWTGAVAVVVLVTIALRLKPTVHKTVVESQKSDA
jgi:drug/metabolite transporter (DMT)-like permease